MKIDQVLPTLFIRGDFWQRPYKTKLLALQERGIDVVVCTIRQTDPDLVNVPGLMYHTQPLSDGATVHEAVFTAVAEIVVAEIRAGHRVLVHCRAGRNRSGLVVGLAVRQLLGVSGQEAYDRVKAARPGTFGNPVFAAYLRGLPPPVVARTPARRRSL